MAIRVDRDVLYFPNHSQHYKNDPIGNEEAPQSMACLGDRGRPCMLFAKGSLTVEAAFSGTIFFLALFSLLYLFRIAERYNGAQIRLADAVRRYECYGIKSRFFLDDRRKTYSVGWDEQEGICYVKHRENIPFLGSKVFRVSWYQQMKFNSYQGKSMVSQGQEAGEYVYLADHGKVYHRDGGCVYLKPEIQEVFFGQLEEKRNVSGGKYYSCGRCGKGANPAEGSRVFITPYGDNWHMEKGCSGLKRSARKVRIEDVGGLPPCSKCGRL